MPKTPTVTQKNPFNRTGSQPLNLNLRQRAPLADPKGLGNIYVEKPVKVDPVLVGQSNLGRSLNGYEPSTHAKRKS